MPEDTRKARSQRRIARGTAVTVPIAQVLLDTAATGAKALVGKDVPPLSPTDVATLARTGTDLKRDTEVKPFARLSVGRGTNLTPAVHEAIVTSIANGSTSEAAAAAAGIAERTLYSWLQQAKGEKPNPRCVQLMLDVTRAKQQAVSVALNSVFVAGTRGYDGLPPDWRAAVEWLRLMYPTAYGKRLSVDMSEAKAAAERVAREHGLEGHEEDILALANEIATSAGAGAL